MAIADAITSGLCVAWRESAVISIEHIRLQFARLARHTECATAGYDPVTCLDLAHSLRIWVDMKADVDQTLAAMNAKPRFHNVAPDQRIKQILKGSDYVAIAGGARIRQEGKIEGFVCTGKILSENQIEQIWKMGPPLSSKTDLTFSQSQVSRKLGSQKRNYLVYSAA